MKSKLKKHDLKFIQWLKEHIECINLFVSLDSQTNTFSWVDNLNNGMDYKDVMLEALINDFTHDTHTYHYELSISREKNVEVLINTFLYEEKLSQYFQLKFLDLFEGDRNLLIPMFNKAKGKNKPHFMLNLLEHGAHHSYLAIDSENNKFSPLMSSYRKLVTMNAVDITLIQESFINRLKKGNKKEDAELISLYLALFEEKDLPLLLNAFNIQSEEMIVSVQENAYSRIGLNLKSLALIHFTNESAINSFSYNLEELNLDFPKFKFEYMNQKNLYIIFEAGEHNSEKMSMLFNLLVSKRYNHVLDCVQEFKTLLDFVSNINEKVYLDNAIGTEIAQEFNPIESLNTSNKKNKFKV
jgi:hypothetical protein